MTRKNHLSVIAFKNGSILCIALFIFFLSCNTDQLSDKINSKYILMAEKNGRLASEAFDRCNRYVKGWLHYADPESGLIPKNLSNNKDIWNAKDAAADNYPFMVLTTFFTNQNLFEGKMHDMLRSEKRLTSRLDALPDTYSFSKKSFEYKEIDLDRLIFGGSEYIKDGLLPLTEWLGDSPWAIRMLSIVDAIWAHAPYPTPFGNIPAKSHEVNGEMLQVLSRLYWMTRQEKYLVWAFRLADYYLLYQHPLETGDKLRLRDHGCEIIAGLSEIYETAHFIAPEKKKIYQQPIQRLFDRILETGRNEHGMLYNWVNLKTGEHDDKICDTWGYNYNAFYTLYLIDNKTEYLQAVKYVLSNLNQFYQDYNWENGSADGYADAIEGAINLYNREPALSVAEWIDKQILIMWEKQQPNGIIEGWHGDGNFARTTIMYALWKTEGLWIDRWREDVKIGAVYENDYLYITVQTDQPWQGRIRFDCPRHRDHLHLPLDYPRINQFPEWYTVDIEGNYQIQMSSEKERSVISGEELLKGFPVTLLEEQKLVIWMRVQK